jgi:hypothetical protein
MTPAVLVRLTDAFDHDDFIFELKMDGIRALAFAGADQARLVSRRGNVYKRFTELAVAIHMDLDCEAVLDGEIVCPGFRRQAAVLRSIAPLQPELLPHQWALATRDPVAIHPKYQAVTLLSPFACNFSPRRVLHCSAAQIRYRIVS